MVSDERGVFFYSFLRCIQESEEKMDCGILHFILHSETVGKGIDSRSRKNVRIGVKPRLE